MSVCTISNNVLFIISYINQCLTVDFKSTLNKRKVLNNSKEDAGVFTKSHFAKILNKPIDKSQINIDPQVEAINENFFTMAIIVSIQSSSLFSNSLMV